MPHDAGHLAAPVSPSTRIADDAELERLILACARRDGASLRRLYELTAPGLLGVMLRILRRRALAEETLQEVFVSIWQGAARYAPDRGRPRAWLYSIARYRAIDALRRERDVLDASVDAERLIDPQSAEADDSIVSGRLAAALARCLEELSAGQRRGIELAFVEGLSHGEISSSLGEPLGTVKSWIRRGLAALRECLEP